MNQASRRLGIPSDSHYRKRALAVHAHFKTLPESAKQLLVIEICDCPDGMPQSRMIDLVNAVRPFCRAVIARVSGDAPPVARWKSAGLSGVAILVEGTNDKGGKAEMLRLSKIADAAAGSRTIITAHGLRKRESVLAAWASGFTHVSGQVVTDQAKTDERPVRLSAVDIFVD